MNKEIALLVTTDTSKDIFKPTNDKFANINISVVQIDEKDGKPRNLSHDEFYNAKHHEYYADLWITCQMDDNPDRPRSYAWRTKYYPYGVNQLTARKMYKTLESINRRYKNQCMKIGYPESFGSYVARIAHLLKIKKVFFRKSGAGRWYTDNEYKTLGIDSAQNEINDIAQKLIDSLLQINAA